LQAIGAAYEPAVLSQKYVKTGLNEVPIVCEYSPHLSLLAEENGRTVHERPFLVPSCLEEPERPLPALMCRRKHGGAGGRLQALHHATCGFAQRQTCGCTEELREHPITCDKRAPLRCEFGIDACCAGVQRIVAVCHRKEACGVQEDRPRFQALALALRCSVGVVVVLRCEIGNACWHRVVA
jgi:hypothetical protein